MKSNNPFLSADRGILGDSGTSAECARNLDYLCNKIGPRFAGTEGYKLAAEYMLSRFKAYKLDRAWLEPFEFTAWRRGDPAVFSMTRPRRKIIDCYQLPYSAPTAQDGIEAPVVDVGSGSEKHVKSMGKRVAGSIVLTDGSAGHRSEIYKRCVNAGAVGFVLSARVKGAGCITGSVYGIKRGALPAISVSMESGAWLRRSVKKGSPRFRLITGGSFEKSTTWNVIGELRGTKRPGELVIMGGHLDSHEISPGAMDNAAGAVAVMETARLLARRKRHLERTVRFVGFAAEEIGLLGSHHHARKHAGRLKKARFMLNSDCPSMGCPKGLVFHKSKEAELYLKVLSEQMETPIVYKRRFHRHSDHYPFILKGVTTAGMSGGTFGPRINHYCHMAGDTAEKISIVGLREAAAFAARILVRASSDAKWLKAG